MKDEQTSFVQKYIQYSKKITLFGMIQWCVFGLLALSIAVVSAMRFGTLDEYSMGITKTVVTWSATVAFVGVGSYEINSAIEKYVKQNIINSITSDVKQKDDNNGGIG